MAHHALVSLEAANDADSVTCELALDRGRTLTGTVLGLDGKPLAGARVSGLKSCAFTYFESRPLDTAAFTALGLKEGRPRNLLFLHDGKKLAGSLWVRGNEKGPLTVRLEPWGTVIGRLVTADGQPKPGTEVSVRRSSLDDPRAGDHPTEFFPVAKDGRFRIEGLIPGLKYKVNVYSDGRSMFLGTALKDLTIKAGETKDLGDVEAKQ